MFVFKKMVLGIIYSPAIFVMSVICLFCNLRLKHCRKLLLCNLNLEVLDQLNLNEFTEIIIMILKTQKIKILKTITDSNCNVIVASKHKQQILVNVANCNQINITKMLVNINNFSTGYECGQKVLISKSNLPQTIITQAKKCNIKLLNLSDIEKALLNLKKPF